jgi:hypothetical protein
MLESSEECKKHGGDWRLYVETRSNVRNEGKQRKMRYKVENREECET